MAVFPGFLGKTAYTLSALNLDGSSGPEPSRPGGVDLVVGCLPLAALGFPFALLPDGQLVADDAADRGARQGVVVGEVTGDAADNGPADTAGLSRPRHHRERNGAGYKFDLHG